MLQARGSAGEYRGEVSGLSAHGGSMGVAWPGGVSGNQVETSRSCSSRYERVGNAHLGLEDSGNDGVDIAESLPSPSAAVADRIGQLAGIDHPHMAALSQTSQQSTMAADFDRALDMLLDGIQACSTTNWPLRRENANKSSGTSRHRPSRDTATHPREPT
jgi:hypothetical protein